MKNKILNLKVLLGVAFFSIVSCETVDLDGTENPNALTAEQVDPNYLLNSIQSNFADFHYEVSDDSRGVVRMVNQFGSYSSAADPQNTQTQWSLAFASILKEVQNMKALNSDGSLPYHEAIAKILESYTYVSLVDFYGDVPYSEALLGPGNLNPSVDSGSDIYDAMLVNIDEALALLAQPVPVKTPSNDFYYNKDWTKWVKLGNSLKIKIYNNLRLTRDVSAEVNAIVSAGDIFTSNADDFNFKYSTNNSGGTDSRHPDFVANYDGSPDFYLSNSYYLLMLADKPISIPDPRVRYYFYRQTSSAPSGQNLPCSTQPNVDICYVGGGYWGRDHADNSGIPNDAARRTVVGLYPAGGRFDNSRFQQANTSSALNNANGAGILNILDYSFVQFMLAELTLTEPGVTGNAGTYLDAAVNANIAKVTGFRTDLQILSPSGTNFVPTATTITNYKNEVSSRFMGAATTNDKLNVIMKEFFIASWGNGLEAYNLYRRTGLPANDGSFIGIQSPVTAAGNFVRSFFYPTNAVNNNSSIIQHTLDTQVFWDNNPAGFID